MENQNNEQVIFVKDLLFAALYQWRRIVAAALLFAVALGVFSLFSEIRKSSLAPSEQEKQAAYEQYEQTKQLLTTQLETAEKLYASQKEYYKSSVYVKLDPYHVYQATIELTVPVNPEILYAINAAPQDNVGAILYAYKAYLSSDPVIAAVAKEMDLEAKYLWELIHFGYSEATRSLSMTVNYTTQEGAQKLLDLFLVYFQQAQQQVKDRAGDHVSNIVVSSVNERIDQSLTSTQSNAKTHLENLEAEVAAVQEALGALSEPVFTSSSVSVKKVVLLAAVGAVLGSFLIAGIAWLGYISNGKVYSARTLRSATGIRVLGCLPVKERKNAVDRWLRKLEGRSTEPQLDVIAAAVRNCCPGKKLLITGDATQQEALSQELQKLGLQPCVCGNLLDNTQALEALPSCDAVLLVESCGSSQYTQILQTAERVADQNKPIIGCVLLEG